MGRSSMVAHQAGIIGLSSGFRNIKNDLNLNVRYEYLTKSDFAHVKSSLQKNIIDKKKNLSKVRWDNLLSLCLY